MKYDNAIIINMIWFKGDTMKYIMNIIIKLQRI